MPPRPPPPARSHHRGCVPKARSEHPSKGLLSHDFLAATVALRHGEAAQCLLLTGMLIRGPPLWWGRGGGRETGSCLWGRDVAHGLAKKKKTQKKAHMQQRRRPAEQPGAWQSNQRPKQEKAWGTQRVQGWHVKPGGQAEAPAHQGLWLGGDPCSTGGNEHTAQGTADKRCRRAFCFVLLFFF